MQADLPNTLNTRWDEYKIELKSCRREFSEEAVHDFRVAARRLLGFLDLLRMVTQARGIKKMRRALKDQLDNLDKLRDTQVLLSEISKTNQELSPLRPFQEYLRHREIKLLRSARKKINALKITDLSRRIHKLNRSIETFARAGNPVDLFSAVDKAYAEVSRRYVLVDPDQPATIHRLRIAFKKFRYMIEVIYPILENPPADYLKRMHNYQSIMGDIQDMEAALQELSNFENLAPSDYDPEPVRSHYNERHAFAISLYIKDKGEVLTFWRPTPDQPFSRRNKP